MPNGVSLSILTLTYNHCDYIAALRESLVQTASGLDWEWLVGDGGTDGTDIYLKQLNDSRIKTFKISNGAFSASQNFLAQQSRGSHLLLLNNDVRLLRDWWQPLLKYSSCQSVGIVGSLILNEDMTLQSFGMGLDPEIEELSYNFSDVDYASRSQGLWGTYIVPAVTGACMIMRRDVFDLLGGFDGNYERGYYEDTDLCLRALAFGYRVLVSGQSRIVHKGRGSLDVSHDYWRGIPGNKKVFATRWAKVIRRLARKGPFPFESLLPHARAACLDRWLTTMGGGEYELLRAALVLARHCREVCIYFDGDLGADELRNDLEARFDLVLPSNVYLLNNMDSFAGTDVVWDQTYYDLTANYQSERCLHLKRVMFGSTEACPVQGPFFLFNSNYTKDCLPRVSGGSVLFPPVQPVATWQRLAPMINNKGPFILSVGRFAQRQPYLNWKNQICLIDFFHSLSIQGVDGLRLIVVGGIDDVEFFETCRRHALAGPARERILLLGNADHATLNSCYEQSMFYLTFCGYDGDTLANKEHFGIALVEAMSAGCICMAYDAGGYKEIIDHGYDGFLWHHLSELTELIDSLYSGKLALKRAEIAKQAYFKSLQFSRAFFEIELEYFLDGWAHDRIGLAPGRLHV